MIRECKVLLNNSAVTVVRFGETDVQLPPIGRDADTVAVSFENGRYAVVDMKKTFLEKVREEEKKEEQPQARRQMKKKPAEPEEETE